MFTYKYMGIYIYVYIQLYEYVCMFIITRVIINVYIQYIRIIISMKTYIYMSNYFYLCYK